MNIALIILTIIILLYVVPFGIYFNAVSNGVNISLLQLIVYRFYKLPPGQVLSYLIDLKENGVEVSYKEILNVWKNGGDLDNIICGIKMAKKAELNLSFSKAVEADMAGIDLSKTVRNTINQNGDKKRGTDYTA